MLQGLPLAWRDLSMQAMAKKLVWAGVLAVGGRTSEEFDARVYRFGGAAPGQRAVPRVLLGNGDEVRIYRVDPDDSETEVHATQIAAAYWPRALVGLAEGAPIRVGTMEVSGPGAVGISIG